MSALTPNLHPHTSHASYPQRQFPPWQSLSALDLRNHVCAPLEELPERALRQMPIDAPCTKQGASWSVVYSFHGAILLD